MSADDVPGGDAGRHLFGLAPDEFTAARNALAKQLRATGAKAEAALVAKLRRPPSTAWALNKVARERPDLIDAVVAAGAALRAATEEALAGDASSLRPAHAEERRAVDTATAVAAGYLAATGQGAGDGPRQRMAGTLRAAMVDPGVAVALGDGVLDDDRDAPGFGLDALSPSAAGTAARRRSSPLGGRPPSTAWALNLEAEAVGAPAVDEVTVRRESEQAAERAAAAEAVGKATQQAARSATAADEAERGAQAARDAAVTARARAEAAATHASELEATAEAASAEAAAARAAASDAAARATELANAADPS